MALNPSFFWGGEGKDWAKSHKEYNFGLPQGALINNNIPFCILKY